MNERGAVAAAVLGPAARRGSRAGFDLAATWILTIVGALPLLLASPAPLQDWPNHLAGAHVLSALLDGDPFWRRFYTLNTFLVPNAAVDLGLLGFRALGLGEAAAATAFLLVTYAVFVGGMVRLSRALAAFDATKIPLAILLFYGVAVFWGLVNYVLALGVMWGLVAVWLRVGRARGRLLIAGPGAIALLFAHAVPAVVFPLLLGCFDLARWRAGARLRSCLSAPLALVAVAATLRLLPGETGHDLVAVYTGGDSIGAFVLWKVRVLATVPFGGSLVQDAATLIAVAGTAVAIGLSARLRLGVGAALGIVALALLMFAAPERLGTGSMLDTRLAPLPFMLAAMAIRLDWRGPMARPICVAVVSGLVVVRTLVIAAEWRAADRVFAAFDADAARLAPGSVMMMAHGRPLAELSWTDIWSPPIQSIAAQVVRRGVFFPALFANPDQQPIALRGGFAALGQPWDVSDPSRRAASLAALRPLCGDYRGVFVTVLYGAVPFEIVDACEP